MTFSMVTNRFLCSACSRDFQPVQSPLCCRCGDALTAFDAKEHLCENCIRSPRHFYLARAVGIYEGALKQLIQDFKFHGKIYLAEPLGLLMTHVFHEMYAQNFQAETFPDTIIPVPLYAERLRMRGFNQAYLLADRFVRLRGRHAGPGSPPMKTDRTILLRCRRTIPQTGLNKSLRKKNIAGAFRVESPEKAAGKHILLMDDVYTTGATVDECAQVLIHAGAFRVDVLTLARA
jgi:ComF family protein